MILKFNKILSKVSKALTIGVASTALWACTIGGGEGVMKGPSVDLSQPVKVAFLAPTGASEAELARIGRSLEQSAKLAVQELGASGEIDLMFLPTNFTEASAVANAKKAQANGAALIIGPLSGFNAAKVAAQVPEIPVMTFSNNGEIVAANTYLLGTSFDVIADRVVSFVSRSGAKNLGILSTSDASGDIGLAATIKAASENGMNVVYNAKYPISEEAIEAQAPSIAASLKSTGADALMLTDDPGASLGIMTNALAKQGYRSSDAQYMGLSRWNAFDNFFSTTQLEGGYFAVPDIAASKSFEQRYSSAYGSAPHPLGGVGYDGVAAAIIMIRDAKRTFDNTPFSSDDIMRLNFNGALGTVKFNNDKHIERSLSVMQVRDGKAVVVSTGR